jgi:hypothetical protein
MRLWTLHPRYLDSSGLVALWREGLLAQAVLRGRTRGYRHHPQLIRFRDCNAPVSAIAQYLRVVHEEAKKRGFRFDGRKIARRRTCDVLEVRRGQVIYEWQHLRVKLERRAPHWLGELELTGRPEVHPLFRVVPGGIESWEK